MPDLDGGECLCPTAVSTSAVFDRIESITKADVMSQLFLGARGPPDDSVPIVGDGFKVHAASGKIDEDVVFEVEDKGRTLFLKNVRSTVTLEAEAGSSTSAASFRNPPGFMSIIADRSPAGSEQNLRDAQYETTATLEQYFYHDNVAPFLCLRLVQRLVASNASPRYVSECTKAFRSGSYKSGGQTFGSGSYGSLEAMVAAIVLDKEATDPSLKKGDPSNGALREPILMVLSMLRSMEFEPDTPETSNGLPMPSNSQIKLWEIDQKIGQAPHAFPSVFSFLLPEYMADVGPTLSAGLVSPEAMLKTMPNQLGLLSGMFSLAKFGLSDCAGGFSSRPAKGKCGSSERSIGRLSYQPNAQTHYEEALDLALLLTAGRLHDKNLRTIVTACASQPDKASRISCMQQLMVTTAEFQSSNYVTPSDEERVTTATAEESSEPYKAIVYLFLRGGVDSFNMLAPYSCAPIDVYKRYRKARGQTDTEDGVGLPLNRMFEVPANNDAQPCSSFGIPKELQVLKDLYENTLFVANAGLLAKPVTTRNYRGETPVQLFSHNTMQAESKTNDLMEDYFGTGVAGRIAHALTRSGIPTNTFSIKGQQTFLAGEFGAPLPYTLGEEGLATFNEKPVVPDMKSIMKDLNRPTTTNSGFFADTHSSKLMDILEKYESLEASLANVVTSTEFPVNNKIASQLQTVSQLMQTAASRGSKRDIYYVEDTKYDTHSNIAERLSNNFLGVNGALEAFVKELKELGLWESTVILQFSEFGRTLSPNTNDGTDHAWGGNHFMLGGKVRGGRVLGQYPHDFEPSSSNDIVLGRGRIIPTHPWDAMLKGAVEWFGVAPSDVDRVLPMRKNFPSELIYGKEDLFEM